MEFALVAKNFLSPPVLFFFLGLIAVALKSDLDIPRGVGKFLTLYLLFDIGIKGGYELSHSGFSLMVIVVLGACLALAVAIPLIAFQILRRTLDVEHAGAVAASYGSVSAVTFATALAFLHNQEVGSSGFMVAAMAFMESPAIIVGLVLVRLNTRATDGAEVKLGPVIRESLVNGSVLLLLGSLLIGFLSGSDGHEQLKPFIDDIFKGMLCLYLLDMGLMAGARMGKIREAGWTLIVFALVFPIICGISGMGIAYLIGLNQGDALLLTLLAGSASYIAVPAAMQGALPNVSMSLLIPPALGITFPFNIVVGIPLYYHLITLFW